MWIWPVVEGGPAILFWFAAAIPADCSSSRPVQCGRTKSGVHERRDDDGAPRDRVRAIRSRDDPPHAAPEGPRDVSLLRCTPARAL
jgi:hypothetical protein